MKLPSDTQEKMMSAYQLLGQDIISINSFEHIRKLVKGVHPGIDEKLEICSKALNKLQKLQSADVITLSAEALPDESEEQKKRKKSLLFLIESIKSLRSEIKRVQTEFSPKNTSQNQLWHIGKVIKFAKGPFGITTLIAIVVVGFLFMTTNHKQTPSLTQPVTTSPTINKQQMQIITYKDKQIPISQLFIGHGSDCDSPHYHAITGTVTSLDGTSIIDPEGCGFGKVKDIQVTTISK